MNVEKRQENNLTDNNAELSDVAKREQEILHFWQEKNIFEKSVKFPAGQPAKGDFVFYDGPPFATGKPHHGHLLAGAIKDAVPRFMTMNGCRVERRWGWDCHGLPLENIVEKRLGLATKRDIEKFGVKKFNETARNLVMEYADYWRAFVPRFGRFVDMDNDYKTMDTDYTESVWWVFKTLYEKGLLYEGFKIVHLCSRCGTTLSNFEVNQGYKDIKDISVYVELPLLNEAGEITDTSLLAWTTTPWTLPGNLAVAIGGEFDYAVVKVKIEGDLYKKFILIKERVEAVFAHYEYEVLEFIKGSALQGRRYQPPFSYWQVNSEEDLSRAWKIYIADFVKNSDDEGTGIVHIAPAYGDDDMRLARDNNLPIKHHVGEDGCFVDWVTDFAGQPVKPKDDDGLGVSHLDADINIIKFLAKAGKLFKKEKITHSYPHCWRCDTPLLNYATTSWFVEVVKIKDRLVDINGGIKWVPSVVGKNRFGKWLQGARDWAISRQRYWGAPLPVWKKEDDNEVIICGSLDELKNLVKKSHNNYFMVRHGESDFNVKGILNAVPEQSDNNLTALGREQVVSLAKRLKTEIENIDLIYYSPLPRTKQTADILAKEIGLSEEFLIADERLTEIKFGEFENRPYGEYHDFFEDGDGAMRKRPKGGETWLDVKKRVGELLYEIDNKYSHKNILFVSHNGTLQMLQAAAGVEDEKTVIEHINNDTYDLKNAELRPLSFTPLPHNDNFELDLHLPYIDEVSLEKDGVKLTRIKDVFDCWFESGSMPYGKVHYPFENKDTFLGKYFPAQFIAEGLDQTRGWFYSMLVLGVALFDRAPYENVIVNGLVLAEDGKKMSKSLNNYPDPEELVNKVGADSIRFYLLSSPVVKGESISFLEKDIVELQRKNIGRLHNVLMMWRMYGGVEVEASGNSNNILDKWIDARLRQLITDITNGYKNYELDKATRPITGFIDDLSVWYLRRSRDRLKGDNEEDKKQSLSTLRQVLRQLSLVMAPSMPFYADYLWQAVKSDSDTESVHLAAWPEIKVQSEDGEIIERMKHVREIVSLALEARVKAMIKVRQPITSVTGPELSAEEADLVLSELNAKSYLIGDKVEIDTVLTEDLKSEGAVREFMRAIQSERKKIGLSPDDPVSLLIDTDNVGKDIIESYKDLILKTVGANNIKWTDIPENRHDKQVLSYDKLNLVFSVEV